MVPFKIVTTTSSSLVPRVIFRAWKSLWKPPFLGDEQRFPLSFFLLIGETKKVKWCQIWALGRVRNTLHIDFATHSARTFVICDLAIIAVRRTACCFEMWPFTIDMTLENFQNISIVWSSSSRVYWLHILVHDSPRISKNDMALTFLAE